MIIDDISQRKKEEVVKRKAEQIEVLNRFVSQLTHEIKNPMVAIRTFSELLPDRYEDPEFRDIFAKTVNAEIKRLNELVDQLIAFSSSMHYNYETVFVNELLGDMLEQLKKKHKNGRMKIKAMLCRDNPTVKADKKNLARAFLYLADFFVSSSEKPVITVKTACMENNNTMPRVNILITDTETQYNGLDIDQLFNPLEYSPENQISLSLPVSKKIIEDHQGHLRLMKSEDGIIKFGISIPAICMNKGEGVKNHEQ